MLKLEEKKGLQFHIHVYCLPMVGWIQKFVAVLITLLVEFSNNFDHIASIVFRTKRIVVKNLRIVAQ